MIADRNLLESQAVPLHAAPFTSDYPQFLPASSPTDDTTVRSWRGTIKPFADDTVAKFALVEMELERPLWISAGQILGGTPASSHWAAPLLVRMDQVCDVLICEQQNAIPRAYLLSPRFHEYYGIPGIHPHPRSDQLIEYGGIRIPGLCVFSSAEFVFEPGVDPHTQFLDQVTQYVAKHLIWLRTRRRLKKIGASEPIVLHQPQAGAYIDDTAPIERFEVLPTGLTRTIEYWSGFWPGKIASASTPLEHLQKIRPNGRCWCGMARKYGDCHRSLDLASLPEDQRKRY